MNGMAVISVLDAKSCTSFVFRKDAPPIFQLKSQAKWFLKTPAMEENITKSCV